MPSFGPWELLILLAIVVIIFGVGKLSDVGGAVGKSIREFRRAQTDDVTETKVTETKVVTSKPDGETASRDA